MTVLRQIFTDKEPWVNPNSPIAHLYRPLAIPREASLCGGAFLSPFAFEDHNTVVCFHCQEAE